MDEQILDAWQIHNRINLYVLDAIAPDALGGVSASKGRAVGEEFAHMHNVRLLWLEPAAPALLAGLAKLDKGTALDHAILRQALTDSGAALAALLRQGLAAGGKIKGYKPHLGAFFAYIIAHEAYHRGEIGLILAQSGHPLDKTAAYGQWEWGKR